ncbi:MAG: HAMP domain-containing protein [Butyricicoccaceae bacterium]
MVERQIWIIIGVSLLACLVFLIFVVASNSYFIRSIVDPVLKINNIAKEIAAGRYGVRLQKTYDDEIGELCDTINYMSDEINRAERMKNDFISSVSHELRTPLTAIGGWSETLLAGGGEDPGGGHAGPDHHPEGGGPSDAHGRGALGLRAHRIGPHEARSRELRPVDRAV